MIRRPPRSTLFPYTRSSDLSAAARQSFLATASCGVPCAGERREPGGHPVGGGELCRVAERRQDRDRPRRVGADRKSTRLNSSHLGISYAVFCLKKKKDAHRR